PGVFERLKSPSRRRASPALEYLGHVLPRGVFRPVQNLFESGRTGAVVGSAADEGLAERILQAWKSGDDWLRACAVHASRVVADFDSSRFVPAPDDGALVRGELAALSGNGPARIAPAGAEQSC